MTSAAAARTVAEWRRQFLAAASAVWALGFGPVFQRMWNLYLAYSEAGFRADIWTSTSSFWSAGGDQATARPRRTAG